MRASHRGFTLIELLVVISIIGMLSSIVLASVNSARSKAKDATIKAELIQMANVAELNYSDYGSYAQLQTDRWVTASSVTCDNVYSGTYASQAAQICKTIVANASTANNIGTNYLLYNGNSVSTTNAYSFMAPLNNGNWFCVGSSGARGEYPNYYGYAGCYNIP